jgi:superfamily II DNA/RNA helicase
MAKALDPHDPKLAALKKIARDKLALPNNRLMVFSSFRHTLKYLNDQLVADGLRVGLIHGGTSDEMRLHLRDCFRAPREDKDALDVLLFSDVGCEGLDYQFCDALVNYDLPWNPMRVEQRIGRLDRKGQKSAKVLVYNFVTPGTVDADIYERCLLRIGVFNSAIGGSEEILGQVTREIRNIAESIALSPEEKREQLQQLADNNVRLIREQEDLEEKQFELFGIRVPNEQARKEVDAATNHWLSAFAMENLVRQYLMRLCGDAHAHLLGDKPLKTLRLSQDARRLLLEDYRRLDAPRSLIARSWEDWLKGAEPMLQLTFD